LQGVHTEDRFQSVAFKTEAILSSKPNFLLWRTHRRNIKDSVNCSDASMRGGNGQQVRKSLSFVSILFSPQCPRYSLLVVGFDYVEAQQYTCSSLLGNTED
jgi:hypothetical protein